MEKNYPDSDRRLYSRCIIEGSAALILKDDRKEPIVVIDLCPRGAGIYCNQALEVGAEVGVEISYFFDKIVQKKAKVVWCLEVDKGSWRIGLDFGMNNLLDLGKSSPYNQ